MSQAPLRHVFFTNAVGRGGDGYRILSEPAGWAAEAERPARWLEALVADPPGGRGWAVNVFRLPDAVFSCVAAVDGAFGPDAHGRGQGHLAHLVAVPVAEGRGELPSLPALLALVRSLARPPNETGDLDEHLARARAAGPPAADDGRARLADLACLDRELLGRFLEASATACPGETVPFPVPAGADLPALLARAAGALPPRLRLAARWGVGLRTTSPVGFLARPGAADGSAPAGRDAARYLDWLLERLDAADTAPIRRVTGDWEIRSWDHLTESTR